MKGLEEVDPLILTQEVAILIKTFPQTSIYHDSSQALLTNAIDTKLLRHSIMIIVREFFERSYAVLDETYGPFR